MEGEAVMWVWGADKRHESELGELGAGEKRSGGSGSGKYFDGGGSENCNAMGVD